MLCWLQVVHCPGWSMPERMHADRILSEIPRFPAFDQYMEAAGQAGLVGDIRLFSA